MGMKELRMSTESFTYYNHNPKNKKRAADCVPRAIGGALEITWEEAVKGLTEFSLKHKGVLNEKFIYEAYLKAKGWVKNPMPKKPNGKKYTIKEFQSLKPKGVYIISVANHLTFIKDGILYDTFNCSKKSVGNYYTKSSWHLCVFVLVYNCKIKKW